MLDCLVSQHGIDQGSRILHVHGQFVVPILIGGGAYGAILEKDAGKFNSTVVGIDNVSVNAYL